MIMISVANTISIQCRRNDALVCVPIHTVWQSQYLLESISITSLGRPSHHPFEGILKGRSRVLESADSIEDSIIELSQIELRKRI